MRPPWALTAIASAVICAIVPGGPITAPFVRTITLRTS